MDLSSTFPLPPKYFFEQPVPLLPPPIPKDDYTAFGITYKVDDIPLPPLKSHGIRQLYSDNYNRKVELEKILKSIVVCYLDLLNILINNPDSLSRIEKLEDLNLLFINISHLINEYRPIQAKYFLHGFLKRQFNQRKLISLQLRESLSTTKEMLLSMKSLLPTSEIIKNVTSAEIVKTKRRKEQLQPDIVSKEPIDFSRTKDFILCSAFGN